MSTISSKAITGAKYIYLIIFFALLSGFFHPLITGATFDNVIFGVIILFVGLAGSVLVYKAATGGTRRMIFFGAGFGLIAISFVYILQFTGRVT